MTVSTLTVKPSILVTLRMAGLTRATSESKRSSVPIWAVEATGALLDSGKPMKEVAKLLKRGEHDPQLLAEVAAAALRAPPKLAELRGHLNGDASMIVLSLRVFAWFKTTNPGLLNVTTK
jgi:hypothetical protein